MIPPVFTLLSTNTDITDIVGTSPARIFHDDIPQNLTVDANGNPVAFIRWQIVGGESNNYLSERPGIDNPRVQIDCYAPTRQLRTDLVDAVQFSLDLNAQMIGQPITGFEAETKLYYGIVDYSFWLNR